MNNDILNLKNEIEPYYHILKESCELTVLIYEALEMILNYKGTDESIETWLYLNKQSIDIVRNKIEKIKKNPYIKIDD